MSWPLAFFLSVVFLSCAWMLSNFQGEIPGIIIFGFFATLVLIVLISSAGVK